LSGLGVRSTSFGLIQSVAIHWSSDQIILHKVGTAQSALAAASTDILSECGVWQKKWECCPISRL